MPNEKLYTQEDMDKNYETGRRNGNGEGHNIYASKETLEKFCEVNEKIDCIGTKTNDIHSAFFGVDNVGGLVKTVERIEQQTIKTNGRVNDNDKWKATATGVVTGVGICMSIILTLVVFIFFDKVNQLNEKIETSQVSTVAAAVDKLSNLISQYNIEIK